jgi:hypothetical protein
MVPHSSQSVVWPHSPFELHYLNFKYCGQRVNKLSGNNTEKPTSSINQEDARRGRAYPFLLYLVFWSLWRNKEDISSKTAKAEFLNEVQTKVLRVFLLAIHSHLIQLCLEIYISSNSRNLLQFLQFSYCTL